ncbi:MAG TPA: hypothetical protein VFO05_07380 [Candidatus Limnocylindrales bacterium]|nr:hypothetical protein [Candidatus Limnocylindrales bacterium]
MNTDTNLAAWMIARGHLAPDPGYERDRAHRLALATAMANDRPPLSARISAAVASLRMPRAQAEPACCPA